MVELLSMLPPVLFLAFVVLDVALPARVFPRMRFWKLKSTLLFLLIGGLATVVPLGLAALLGEHGLFDLSSLGILGGFVVAQAATTLVAYWMHRSFHVVKPLWRGVHQMHHSAERLDIWSANLLNPLEIMLGAAVGSVVSVLVLGVVPEAAALVGAAGAFNAFFQHANLHTPRWLGYFVQRPEMHLVHHQRGVHAFNYSDLPLWDILFGTFRNPAVWEGQVGFYDGASARMVDMLLGRDVSQPRPGETAAA